MIAVSLQILSTDITIELKYWHENQLIKFNVDESFDKDKIFAIFINDMVDVHAHVREQQHEFKSLSHGNVECENVYFLFIFPS